MAESSVNNLNGVPNFGHGMPDDGVVIAGVTDVIQTQHVEEETVEGVQEATPEDDGHEEEAESIPSSE